MQDTVEDINNDGSFNALDCAGPQGLAGAIGAQGPQGDAGPAGADGATGPAGADGAGGITTFKDILLFTTGTTNFPANWCYTEMKFFEGVMSGDTLTWGYYYDSPVQGIFVSTWISGDEEITFRSCNVTPSPIDTNNLWFSLRAFRYDD